MTKPPNEVGYGGTHKSAFCKRGSVDARFAPKATEVLRSREWRRANGGHSHFQLLGERLAMMLTTLNVITISLA